MMKPLPALDDARLLPPVSPDCYRYFEHAAEHPFAGDTIAPSLRNAWWLAECALAAYADPELAAPVFAQGGLSVAGGAPITGSRHGGQCYVLANEQVIIVAFRGTQVVKASDLGALDRLQATVQRVLKDLATDARVRLTPWPGRAGGQVHQGFADSLQEMLPELSARIAALRAGGPARRLWLTGHSLGGALATLAADLLPEVQGIHVFGSPRVGDATFARQVVFPGWRFRHHCDVIPWVPLEAMGCRHVPHGRYLDRHGVVQPEPGSVGLLLDSLAGTPAAVRTALTALGRGEWGALTPKNLIDHAPLCYAIRLWNAYLAERAAAKGPCK
jgi:triacylglycerol lipase